jgi:predicted permease
MNIFRSIFQRRKLYNDLNEELRQHIEERTEQLMRQENMPRKEAEQAAKKAFGNATLLEEQSREVWQWPTLESIWADAKYALRQLAKSPGITFVAIATLALGIGANTAIFTLTWNIILKGLPVPHPEQLVSYEMRDSSGSGTGLSGPLYTQLRQRQKTSTDIFAMASSQTFVRNNTHTTQQYVQMLTGNAFNVLGLQPALGRAFTEQDDKSQGTQGIPAILSDEYWQSEFHGDPSILGRTLVVDDHPVTIVGVLPRAFDGLILTTNQHPAVYLPMSLADFLITKDALAQPGFMMFMAMGRLRPGSTVAQAVAEAHALEPSMRKAADPSGMMLDGFFKTYRLHVEDGRSGISYLKTTFESPLLVLELLVAFLLILCCVNTALVMLARVSGRQQEYALRAALGARRLRLIRQVLLETLLLAIPGVVAGIALGWYGAHALFNMLGQTDTHMAAGLRPNSVILAFNLVSTFVIVLGAGLLPALRAAKTAPALDLKAADRGVAAKHLGGWAIALQVAVSLCLVSTAFLLGGTLTSLLSQNSGFVTKNAAYAEIGLSALKLDKAHTETLYSRLLAAVQTKPGVTAAGYTSMAPLSGDFGVAGMFSLDSKHVVHSEHNLFYTSATPGFFAAVGTRILAGTPSFAAPDALSRCVLSNTMARFFFPGENPIGQQIRYTVSGKADGTDLDPKNGCLVVAVAEDVHYQSLHKPVTHAVYFIDSPEQQQSVNNNLFVSANNNLFTRAASDHLALAAVRQAMKEVVPAEADVKVMTFTDLANHDLSRERMLVSLSSGFALLALLLTALGLYGLLMRSVNLRTREIGIRVALGAQHKTILMALGKRAFLEVAIGLAAGTTIAIFLSRIIHKILNLPGTSGATGYLLAALLILAVAGLSVLAPARRAATVDPMQALRTE